MPGRTPRCIVLAPTRELANQVEREFAGIGAHASASAASTAVRVCNCRNAQHEQSSIK